MKTSHNNVTTSLLILLLGQYFAFALDLPYSEWTLANYKNAFATFNEGLVSVADGGSDYWHVQLTRSNIELLAGKTYEVKFYLQGVSARRYIEVRIGRDGFPYDAFAEFGEVAATVNGRTVKKISQCSPAMSATPDLNSISVKTPEQFTYRASA